MLANNFVFHAGIMDSINGFKLKAVEPDEHGFFEQVVGCIGVPTRGKVVYDAQSLINAMKDTSSRFNICLRDGNLCGEYGHPVIETKEDMPRLFQIKESNISHYFGAIWTDQPIQINGQEAIPIKAKVKPTGPQGPVLEKQLRDPNHNTSFSIRSLCVPTSGPDANYSYREVQMVITFDAVHAPGFEITSKRYVGGQESYECNVSQMDLEQAATTLSGMENGAMLTKEAVKQLRGDKSYMVDNQYVGCGLTESGIITDGGEIRSAAALLYGRRR